MARRRGLAKQDAVKMAVKAELRHRLAAWRLAHPLPPPTGEVADKAFFDDLSGES